MFKKYFFKAVAAPVVAVVIATGLMTGSVSAAEEEAVAVAFPDSWMIRLGTYIVDGADTQFSVS